MEIYFERLKQEREQEDLLEIKERRVYVNKNCVLKISGNIISKANRSKKDETSPNVLFRQFIEETCGNNGCEEEKQRMEDFMVEFLEDCKQKMIYRAYKDVDDLIAQTLESKLVFLNIKSHHFDPKKQKEDNIVQEQEEVKIITEPEAKNRTRRLSQSQKLKIRKQKIVQQILYKTDFFLRFQDGFLPQNDYHDSEGDIRFLEEFLSNNSPPLPENESFSLDYFDDPSLPRPPPEPPDVKISLNFEPDAPVVNIFDELNEDECFNLGGGEINVSQNVEEDDSFTFVIRTFLPFLTYPEDSPLLLSTGSEDTIFEPGISTFYSLKPVTYENPMVIFPFFCFCPKDKGIRGEYKGLKQSKNGNFRVTFDRPVLRLSRFNTKSVNIHRSPIGKSMEIASLYGTTVPVHVKYQWHGEPSERDMGHSSPVCLVRGKAYVSTRSKCMGSRANHLAYNESGCGNGKT
ncbi:hypothetical protein Tco_0735993 [Tanacetum coccineum]